MVIFLLRTKLLMKINALRLLHSGTVRDRTSRREAIFCCVRHRKYEIDHTDNVNKNYNVYFQNHIINENKPAPATALRTREISRTDSRKAIF